MEMQRVDAFDVENAIRKASSDRSSSAFLPLPLGHETLSVHFHLILPTL